MQLCRCCCRTNAAAVALPGRYCCQHRCKVPASSCNWLLTVSRESAPRSTNLDSALTYRETINTAEQLCLLGQSHHLSAVTSARHTSSRLVPSCSEMIERTPLSTSALSCGNETADCQTYPGLSAVKLHPAHFPAYHSSEGDHAATHWCGNGCSPGALHGHNAAPGRESVMDRSLAKVSSCLMSSKPKINMINETCIKL